MNNSLLDQLRSGSLVSTVSIAGFSVLGIAAVLAAATPGERVPIFIGMSSFGVLAALRKAMKWRIAAVMMVIVPSLLACRDWQSGREFRHRVNQMVGAQQELAAPANPDKGSKHITQ